MEYLCLHLWSYMIRGFLLFSCSLTLPRRAKTIKIEIRFFFSWIYLQNIFIDLFPQSLHDFMPQKPMKTEIKFESCFNFSYSLFWHRFNLGHVFYTFFFVSFVTYFMLNSMVFEIGMHTHRKTKSERRHARDTEKKHWQNQFLSKFYY